MKKSAESSEDFLKLIKKWQVLEDYTITSADKLLSKTDNPLLKTTMEMIKTDSEKHKVILQMILDNLTKEALHLRPDELAPLSDMLNAHMEIEAKSVEIANQALTQSSLFATKYFLSYLLADEAKHHALLSKLDEVKKAAVFIT